MHRCPPTFSSTLEEFVDNHVVPNLLPLARVDEFHRSLMRYLNSNDATYIIRQMSNTIRFRRGIDEIIYCTKEGLRFKASDNHPAWWVHHLLFHSYTFTSSDRFKQIMDDIPTHFFSIPGTSITTRRHGTINTYGYHIAHIYNVKDGNIDYQNYSKQEMVKRFVRNIHPLNYFYIAKAQWRQYGEPKEVRAYFANLFSHKYHDVWAEFIEKAQPTKEEGVELIYNDSYASIHYCYSVQDNSGGAAMDGRFILVNGVPTMMIDVNWKDSWGWKPWQYKSDMDQLEQTPNAKVRFNLLRGGVQRYCIEMNLAEWRGVMQQQMGSPSWEKYGGFWASLTRQKCGEFTETFQPKWVSYVHTCPCEKVDHCSGQSGKNE